MAVPRLRFKADNRSEFPEWEDKKIKDILTICHGKDYKEVGNKNGEYPVLGTGGIITNVDSFLCNWPCVLIGRKGTIDKPQYMDKPFWCVDTLFYSKPGQNQSPKFQYYLFQTINWKRYNEASGVPSLTASTIENIKIKIPCFEEQSKIADCLLTLDAVITNCQSEIDAWEKHKHGIMQQLFSQKVRFKADDGSEYPEWEKRALEECCDTFTDGNWIESKDQSDYGIRLVQTGNIGVTNYLDKPDTKKWISNETFNKLHCIEVFPGDILISRLPDPAGRACIIPDLGTRIITAVDCTIVRTSDECNSNFMVQYLSTSQYFNSVNSFLAGGTRQRISRSNLATITIPYPCLEEQQKIADCLSAFDEVIDKAKQKLEAYKQLKKGLLQQMFV